MEKTTSKPNLWVCVFDLHFPTIHKPTWDATLEFIYKNKSKIAGFIWGGDQMSNEEISHHTKGKPLFRPTGSYLRNHRNFQTQILDPLQAVLPKDAEKIWIEGNHCQWSQQLVESQPELKGLVENHLLLRVEEQGWQFIPCGQRYRLGKLNVIHGEQLSGVGNQASAYHAKKAVDIYAGSVLYGHMHSHQTYTRVLPHDISQKWMGMCAPIAGATNATYLRNRPTAWTNGIVVVEMHGNGNFNMIPLLTTNGVFSYGGVLYGGKK